MSILTNYKQGFSTEIVIVISVKRITLIWYMWCKARSDIHTSRSCYFHKLCHLVLIPGDQLQKGVNEVYYQKRIGRKYPPSLPKYLRMMWHYWPEFIPVDAKNLSTGCRWALTFQPEKKNLWETWLCFCCYWMCLIIFLRYENVYDPVICVNQRPSRVDHIYCNTLFVAKSAHKKIGYCPGVDILLYSLEAGKSWWSIDLFIFVYV